ncbi:MAG: AAA family ATPase [Lachnospiraceae bacterium]|nr:AAA family ATPase [Lachnospiraceae bacterium]
MVNIFSCKDDIECAVYIKRRLDQYMADGGEISSPKLVYDYLRILVHYIMAARPREEQNMDSLLKLLGASFKEKGYRTPFWLIIREAATLYPRDAVYYMAKSIENEFTNDDLEEIFAFMEYELMRQPDREQMEEELGHLAVCRIRYQKSRASNIRMQREPEVLKNKTDLPFMEECRKFLSEYTPRRLKAYLDRFVIGQDETKEVLSTAVYNHFLRITNPEANLIKTNVLMVGPSGCGKTEMIRRLSELLPIPVVITDFSGIVATPWKGRNKEESLLNLYIKSGKDIDLTECGIVFCDEFDKIIPAKLYSRGGDINNELQGQLLGMFEGTDIDVPLQDKQNGQEVLMMNTKNILFICAGAFEGLEKIVKKDYVKMGIGFGSEMMREDAFELTGEKLKTEHLMEYGMKPELAGRLSTVTVLKKLDREAMKRVLVEPEDSILSRYEREFMIEDHVELHFTEDALEVIIDKVNEMNIGARGLNAVVHEILLEALFEVPSMPEVREVLITGAAARREEKPTYL